MSSNHNNKFSSSVRESDHSHSHCREKIGTSEELGYVKKGIQLSETKLLPSGTVGISVDEADKFEIFEDIPYNPKATLVTVNWKSDESSRRVTLESHNPCPREVNLSSDVLRSNPLLGAPAKLTKDHLRSITRHLPHVKCGYRSAHVSHTTISSLFSPPRLSSSPTKTKESKQFRTLVRQSMEEREKAFIEEYRRRKPIEGITFLESPPSQSNSSRALNSHSTSVSKKSKYSTSELLKKLHKARRHF